MSEMSQKEGKQEEAPNDAMGLQEVSGLGALLKNEREKRGLSYEQVAQITRLRRDSLEALENEEWHNLPPSVFVKGFIRSYARAVDMEESKLLDLYHSIGPHNVAPLAPMTGPKKSMKGIVLVLVPVFLLVAFAVILYFWMGKPSSEQAVSDDLPGSSVGLTEMDIPESLPEEEEPDEYSTDKSLLIASPADFTATTNFHILKGIVHLRTWIRIYVDDEAPKEYIFQPGSRPQWKAKEGFYVLIGNAAGIAFDFNGKEFGDLGNLGQVVSLRLPENFERQVSEDQVDEHF